MPDTMRYRRFLLISLFILASIFLATKVVFAWYGAAKNVGVPATTQGLTAEILDPGYNQSPAIYVPGTAIPLTTKVTNPTDQDATVSAYFRVYKITEAPTGTDVSDGNPGSVGLSEAQLFSDYSSVSSVSTLLSTSSFAPTVLPANSILTYSATITPQQPGYYQFVFSTVDSDVDPASGTLLTTGFIRVLSSENATPTPIPSPTATPTPTTSPTNTPTPSPTVSPSPTPTITPVPTATPFITPSPTPTATPQILTQGKQSILALSTPTCTNRNTTVTMRLLLDGISQSGKTINFTYANESKTATTDTAGDASVVYGYKNAGDVHAMSADGYPTQSGTIFDANDCPAPAPESLMGGIKASAGQVLGAYAETGISKADLFAFALFGALAFMAVGLFLYGASLLL